MKKTHSTLFIPGIIMLGIVLRTPFTTLPTVLSDIAAGLGVDVSSLGLLTSLPLLTFAIFSPFAIQFAKKLGIERLFFLVLIAITIGSAIRIINLPFLYLGTILIGAGISFLNVLLPSYSGEQTPPTRHSDHFVHHFYGDVHSDRLFCRCSDHQSHFLARFGQHLDSLVRSCFGHLDS